MLVRTDKPAHILAGERTYYGTIVEEVEPGRKWQKARGELILKANRLDAGE